MPSAALTNTDDSSIEYDDGIIVKLQLLSLWFHLIGNQQDKKFRLLLLLHDVLEVRGGKKHHV